VSSISLSDARALVIANAAQLETEAVPLAEALGHTLAADLCSPIAMPPFANSAMDGYALRAADTEAAPVELRLTGESRAGTPSESPLGEGEIARVSTGAALPPGADCVLRIEDASEAGEGMIGVPETIPAGFDVRPAGDDVEQGDLVIPAGSRIGSGEIAMLAATGTASVGCVRRPRVAIVTTGDELVPPGEALGFGQIHDSNSAMLAAQVLEAGGELVSIERAVVDDPAATTKAIASALNGVTAAPDLVITCGGVSVGRHDHVKDSFAELGVRQQFSRVALRPGHPTWFGLHGERQLVLGLPGNPVSAWVTFEMFAAPALRKLAGRAAVGRSVVAKLGEDQRKPKGNSLVVRCRLERSPEGELTAWPTSVNQRSHAISSLVGTEGLAIVAPDVESPPAGSEVTVELLPSQVL
jgi:molybdopterin molybdotransferase